MKTTWEKLVPFIAVGCGLAAVLFVPGRMVDRVTLGFIVIACVFMADILRMLIWWDR